MAIAYSRSRTKAHSGSGLSTTYSLPALAVLVLFIQTPSRGATLINFELFPNSSPIIDSTSITNQFPGLIFTNATVITAGITLNEVEFPPHSGNNVAFDDGGPITITFAPVVTSFSGYFTHAVPLTLRAFNSANSQVATAISHFSNNEALSGVAGSSPNELLEVSSAGGIARITISGDPSGSSFAMDDISDSLFTTSIPLISPPLFALLTLLLGMLGAALAAKRHTAVTHSILVASFLVPLIVCVSSAPAQEGAYGRESIHFQSFVVSHSRIPANTPTTIAVSLQAVGSTLIPNSGNLLRLEPNGAATLLQRLSDFENSAKNGRDYSAHFTLTENVRNKVHLVVSLAKEGELRRSRSRAITIEVANQ